MFHLLLGHFCFHQRANVWWTTTVALHFSLEEQNCHFHGNVCRLRKCETEAAALGSFPFFACPQAFELRVWDASLSLVVLGGMQRRACVCAWARVLMEERFSLPNYRGPWCEDRDKEWEMPWREDLGFRIPRLVFLSHWEIVSGPVLGILDWIFINEGNVFFRWLWSWVELALEEWVDLTSSDLKTSA